MSVPPSQTGSPHHPLSFAVVGHPNEGKSSVLATLAEDDFVAISDQPGLTRKNQPFPVILNGKELFRLLDTPGFQHPQASLAWMIDSGKHGVDLLRSFSKHFGVNPSYLHDAELARGIAASSGLLYVVNASRPPRAWDEAEMEILRRTGLPRMAILNCKTGRTRYLASWKEMLMRHFNAIRVFNAHRSGFPERMGLLETLASIEQEWAQPIQTAIQAFREDWDKRLKIAAGTILDHLDYCLSHSKSVPLPEGQANESTRTKVFGAYQADINASEKRCFRFLKETFRHRLAQFTIPEYSVLKEDLFSEETWTLMGLSRKRLALTSAGAGALGGAAIDASLSGLSFGIFATAGALLGAAGSYWGIGKVSDIRIVSIPLGGKELKVGPSRNPNFPFILIDRCLLYVRALMSWTHARRDDPPPLADPSTLPMTAEWSDNSVRNVHSLGRHLSSGNRVKAEPFRIEFLTDLTTKLTLISHNTESWTPSS